jgi:hypothetical protein
LRTFIKYKGVLAEVKVIVVNLAYPISVSGEVQFRQPLRPRNER